MRLEGAGFARDGRDVLRDVSLRVEPGERVAIVGGNGAGKSTLLRLLLGLERPTAGRATPCARGAGYVPQAYAESLFPWRTALENVAMPRLVRRDPRALDAARAELERLLPDGGFAARRAGRLSGGEKQAVAIARALASPGDVVLADEPFTALSSSARAAAIDAVRAGLGGRALVLVSHDEGDVARLCDRVLRLRDGALEVA